MVSVVHSLAAHGDPVQSLQALADGLPTTAADRLWRAVEHARPLYAERLLGSG